MSDQLFSALELSTDDSACGYRLDRFEVYNWGTFDSAVWTLNPDGENTLLTGEIGAGKSTLVDAITTLLMPAHKISYNKAAGAQSRERSLRSYVQGHYRSERNEETGTSRPVSLRDNHSYTIILGVFRNEGYNETVTLAQVLYFKDKTGQPERFFVTSQKDLTIKRDFSGFGGDINDLRTSLRAGGATIDNNYPQYGRKMRQLLGIRSAQAMDLFLQTVSMKSVGNLNQYVREHMLEAVDATGHLDAVVSHFENLTKAHQAVRKATEQLELLGPLVASADKYESAVATRANLTNQRDATRFFVADKALHLLTSLLDDARTRLRALNDQKVGIEPQQADLTSQRDSLLVRRAGVGGDRFGLLDAEIPKLEAQVDRTRERRNRYDALLKDAQLDSVNSSDAFRACVAEAEKRLDFIDAAIKQGKEELRPLAWQVGDLERQVRILREQIDSLEQSNNNLPKPLLSVRERLCAALDLDSDTVPFVAELLEVNSEYDHWRGAAERVLRGFALTMLVPDRLFQSVSQWVNNNHLNAHLVFLRVQNRPSIAVQYSVGGHERLADIIDIAETPYEEFVRAELHYRAEHVLVQDASEMSAHSKAVTPNGLIRDGLRHSKDDRHRIDDATQWILGRNTQRQLEALRATLSDNESQLSKQRSHEAKLEGRLRDLERQEISLSRLAEYTSWAEVDTDTANSSLQAALDEREALVAGSAELERIDQQIEDVDRKIVELAALSAELERDIGRSEDTVARLERRESRESGLLEAVDSQVLELAHQQYAALEAHPATKRVRTLEDCDNLSDKLTRQLSREIDTAQNEINGYTTSVQRQMNEVLNRWDELRSQMGPEVESIGEFRTLFERVQRDDLPKYEAEFKRQLNTNALRELASFSNWLTRQSEEIQSRVDKVNEALGAIDYNPGRRILLVTEPTINQEIRQFRAELREATSDALVPDEVDSEARFELVRVLIERFRGREGHAESDKAWTTRVTDVRNWFSFAAAEIDRETGEEHEHYTDSDGKSGGQKEKLAYTILAASLAYQFGLEWGATRSKDFRFAVIDEAFGRGDDSSTRYALQLFAKLGLQLLIVTPLQKVNVIAPFVQAIGYVDSDGTRSRLHSLTIEEYEERRGGSQ